MFRVFKSDDNWFFSEGVTRDFGENCVIHMDNGDIVFAAVMPLVCDPAECGLQDVGGIFSAKE